jgi:hypothetical protein
LPQSDPAFRHERRPEWEYWTGTHHEQIKPCCDKVEALGAGGECNTRRG